MVGNRWHRKGILWGALGLWTLGVLCVPAPVLAAAPPQAEGAPVSESTATPDFLKKKKKRKLPDYSAKNGHVFTDGSVLVKAILAADAAAVRKAIAGGADVNAPTADASYPIIVATQKATVDVMKVLTAHGAQVNVADRFGRGGLHYAAVMGDAEKIKLLVALKAPINALDARQISPLYYAYLNKQIDAAKLMTETLGADVNQADKDGVLLAFKVAEYKDRPDVVQAMIDAGVNLFKRNAKEHTLFQRAGMMGNKQMEERLKTAYEQQIKAYIDKQKQLEEEKKKADE